jgi:hypothetical protein
MNNASLCQNQMLSLRQGLLYSYKMHALLEL